MKFLARFVPGYKVRCGLLRRAGYHIGRDVFIGEDLIIKDELEDKGMVSIGNRVAIADRVTLVVSSHPNFSKLRHTKAAVHRPVRIEDDAWIGTCAVILPGITVGKGAIVGAGSVVTKSVPGATVVAGNPARPLKSTEPERAEEGAEKEIITTRRSA